MARPDGIQRKTKDNSRKKPYEREQWQKQKRSNRPKQQFDPSTKTWSKI